MEIEKILLLETFGNANSLFMPCNHEWEYKDYGSTVFNLD